MVISIYNKEYLLVKYTLQVNYDGRNVPKTKGKILHYLV